MRISDWSSDVCSSDLYITCFFYLAAWGPWFVILNMIFMSRWQDSLASWGANGGLTAANFSGISALNQDVGALAGYMIMSVPFIAAGMARGAMAIASHSASFLSPSQNAAEQAAAEATTGNYRSEEHTSEERRGGKECGSTCRSRWSPSH